MQVSQEHLRTPNIMPRQGHGGTKVSVWTNDQADAVPAEYGTGGHLGGQYA